MVSTPTTGTFQAYANAFAVPKPMRKPVNEPGPMVTAMPVISAFFIFPVCSTVSICGTNCSEWVSPACTMSSLRISLSFPTATLAMALLVSIPKIIGSLLCIVMFPLKVSPYEP